MRVAMQVLAALATSLLVLTAIVHLSGTSDAIARGLDTPLSHHSIRMEAMPETSSKPQDPAQSSVLKQIYSALGADVAESDLSDGSIHVAIAYEGKTIEDGAYVPMRKAARAPTVTVTADDGGKGVYYTWVLVDIDAPRPSDPSHSPFLHYIVANLDPAGRESPVVVVSHYPVSPPFGDHRYVGLLFAQSKLADKNALSGYETRFHDNRMNFKVSDYAERQGLAYTERFFFYSRPAHKTS